jgi:excisionase family DNA binding protein
MTKNQPINENTNLLTQREVAKLLGICPETVCRWTRRGLIPCVRVGRRFLRYERPALAALLSSRRDGKGDAK